MKHLKISILVVLLSGVVSCYFPMATDSDNIFSIIRNSSTGDDDRRATKNSSGSRNSSRGKCRDDDRCEEVCEDIYGSGRNDEGYVESCLDLREKTVDVFEIIEDYFRDPSTSNMKYLVNNYLKEFEDLLEISLHPWVEEFTDQGGRSDSQVVLDFVFKNEEVRDIFEVTSGNNNKILDQYDRENLEDYEGIQNLLKKVADNIDSDKINPDKIDDERAKACVLSMHAICKQNALDSKTSPIATKILECKVNAKTHLKDTKKVKYNRFKRIFPGYTETADDDDTAARNAVVRQYFNKACN